MERRPVQRSTEAGIAAARAHEAFSAGRFDDAERQYRSALRLDPDAPGAVEGLVRCLARRDPRAALDELRSRPGTGDGPAWAEFTLGLLEHGRTELAVEAATTGAERFRDGAWAHALLGMALNAAGKHEAAIASLDRALAIEPGHDISHHYRGVALYELGRFAESIAALERAVEGTDDHDTRSYLARCLVLIGDVVAAREQVRLMREERPGSADARAIEAWIEGGGPPAG